MVPSSPDEGPDSAVEAAGSRLRGAGEPEIPVRPTPPPPVPSVNTKPLDASNAKQARIREAEEDRELIVLAQNGSKPAFRKLVERHQRRAFAIASGALPPSDPLVITSRDNLEDFCAARDLPVEDWPGIGQADVAPAPAPPAPPSRAAQHASARLRPVRAIAATIALAAVATAVVMTSWRSPAPAFPPSGDTTPPAPGPAAPARVDAPAVPGPAAPGPAVAAPAPERPPTATVAAAPAASRATVPAPPPTPPAPSAVLPEGVRVVAAEVCASLTTSGAWRCEALGSAPAPVRAAFYTRIASPRPLRIEHRWYQGTVLRQQVPLSVGANPSAGYRTFSWRTLTPGAWRVELRAPDGTVLHEAAFDVR